MIHHYSELLPYAKWPLRIIGKWSYALIYICAELWSVVVINLLFWQLANHNVKTEQAKRLYPFFGIFGNLGQVLSGSSLVLFSSYSDSEITLKLTAISVTIFGLLTMMLYRYISSMMVSQKKAHVKTKLSISESINMVLCSRYLGLLATMIVCYGLAMNVVEGPWKA